MWASVVHGRSYESVRVLESVAAKQKLTTSPRERGGPRSPRWGGRADEQAPLYEEHGEKTPPLRRPQDERRSQWRARLVLFNVGKRKELSKLSGRQQESLPSPRGPCLGSGTGRGCQSVN